MFSRRPTYLGALPTMASSVVAPSTISQGLAKVAAYIRSQGGADALAAQQAQSLIPQPNSTNANWAAQQAAATMPVGPAPGGMSLTTMAFYGVGGLAALWLLMKLFKSSPASSGEALPVHKNPSRVPVVTRSQRLKRAVESYESFHWGDKPGKFVQKKISKPPKVGVKLGKLVSVAYETHKNGEHAVWEHEFGEEGGKRPDLVMDADNKRLHIVGGSYDVRPEGIID